jgi:hypothetical protein
MRRRSWAQHQEYAQYLEVDRRHPEEVDRDQLLSMILQKCAPSLRRRFAAAHHVFADAALPDIDAELEQFTVDPWCTPVGILSAHLEDQISDLTRNDRSSRLAVPHLPGPENTKALAMPGHDRFGLDEGQPLQMRESQTHNKRSNGVNFGRFLADHCSTPIWWRKARFSSWSAAREWKIEDRVAKRVVREMSIGENYERKITPIRSNISRFSRGTDDSEHDFCRIDTLRTK